MQWGLEEDKTLKALIELLTSPLILVAQLGDHFSATYRHQRAGCGSGAYAGHQGRRTCYWI